MKDDSFDYEIRLGGRMAPGWADWFGGRELRTEGGDSVLTLRAADRSAFYGAFRVLADLDCRIISVTSKPAAREGSGEGDGE